jgi:hypothetical protein
MANDIKIRAKKISELNSDTSFNFEEKGKDTYLIVAYKPLSGTGQNFKLSMKTIIDTLKLSIPGITYEEIKTQLINVLQNNEEVKNLLITTSVLEWAKEHGFDGSDTELWEMFKNGNGGSTGPTGPTGPTEPTDTTNYLFTYASELQEGIFNKDANDNIISVNIEALKGLSYTQEVIGKVPTTNKNGHGFCLQNYNTTYSESYIWDDAVLNGRVWIILPAKFYNIDQNNFIDENGGKWKFCDAMIKNPMVPVNTISLSNFYEGQNYILVCYSEEGQVDEQYFKKI